MTAGYCWYYWHLLNLLTTSSSSPIKCSSNTVHHSTNPASLTNHHRKEGWRITIWKGGWDHCCLMPLRLSEVVRMPQWIVGSKNWTIPKTYEIIACTHLLKNISKYHGLVVLESPQHIWSPPFIIIYLFIGWKQKYMAFPPELFWVTLRCLSPQKETRPPPIQQGLGGCWSSPFVFGCLRVENENWLRHNVHQCDWWP